MSTIKFGPVVVRASAVLLAAGAYDATPAALLPIGPRITLLELRLTYTRGAAGGQCKFKMLTSDTAAYTLGPFERSIDQGTLTITNDEAVTNYYTHAHQGPVPPSASAISKSYLIDVSSVLFAHFVFAETGVVGTPGTVYADFMAYGVQV